MTDVFIVGEDPVTQEILMRLIRDYAPLAKKNLIKDMGEQNANFIINIAVDEAEAWLFADKEGFAQYLEIDESDMPVASLQKFGGMTKRCEMDVPLKSSYFLTHRLMEKSKNKDLKAQSRGDIL